MAQTTLLVDDDAPPGGNGETWGSAFNQLQAALDQAQVRINQGRGPVEIWVARGVYRPSAPAGPDARLWRFELRSDVSLYGGFAGGETRRGDRDPALFEQTILSGDHGGGVNSYHVLVAAAPSSAGTLDGFKITGGAALGPGGLGHDRGGGLSAANAPLRILRCTFEANSAREGGAVHVEAGRDAVFRDCRFVRNAALAGTGGTGNGGAARIEGSWPEFVGCTFDGNTADRSGGAVFISLSAAGIASQPDFVNCTFVGNIAGEHGGAMRLDDANTSIVNSVFSGNLARTGAGGALRASAAATPPPTLRTTRLTHCSFSGNCAGSPGAGNAILNTSGSVVRLRNSIVYHNDCGTNPIELRTLASAETFVEYCCLPGATGRGSIDLDPRFLDRARHDLRLQPPGPQGSPCIDAGNNAYLPLDEFDLDEDGVTSELLPVDRAGLQRLVQEVGGAPLVNMGAYEALLEDSTWIDPNGGGFADPGNWQNGAVPTGRSVAVFALGGVYPVTFSRDEVSYRLRATAGTVTFDLGQGTYRLLGREPGSPALLIGAPSPNQARLRVTGSPAAPNAFLAHAARVGDGAGERGVLDAVGVATSLDLTEGAELGRAGSGRLEVSSGATARSPGLALAALPNSSGTLQVSGLNSVLLYGGPEPGGRPGQRVFRWGDGGSATVSVLAQGLLTCSQSHSLILAEDATSTAVVTIDDRAVWSHTGREFVVGDLGEAGVTIRRAGELSTSSSEQAILARGPGSRATVTLQNAGSRWVETGPILVGGEGDAVLTVGSGAFVQTPLGLTVRPSGSLRGEGEVRAGVISIGEVAPGTPAGTGLLRIQGNYTQVGQGPNQSLLAGRFRVRINGPTRGAQYDSLDVGGAAELHGGLFVEVPGPFAPQLNDTFRILSSQRLDGSRFDVAYLPGLGGDLFFGVRYGEQGSVTLEVRSLAGQPSFGGQFETPLPPLEPVAADLADLDGRDGADLAVLFVDPARPGEPGVCLVLLNRGQHPNGTWRGFDQGTILNVGRDPRDLRIGDIDGNPGPDLVVANAGDSSVMIFTNDPGRPGRLSLALVQRDDIDQPVALALADFSHGGVDRFDIIVANRGSGGHGTILENQSLGGLQLEPSPIPSGPRPTSVDPVRGGTQGSQRIIFSSAEDDTISVVEEQNGSFSVRATIPVGDAPVDAATTDLNRDGRPDIVTANAGDGTVSVVVATPGGYAPAVTLGVGDAATRPGLPRERRLAIADLDGDDDPDIAVAARRGAAREIAILRNDLHNAQLAFTRQDPLPLEQAPVSLLAGPVDADRGPDLVTVGLDGRESREQALVRFNGGAECYPDCDTSTGPGVLDIFDFLCFQNRFDDGDPYACDCDRSTGPGVCDIFDFLCFQNAFVAGCP